MGSASTAALYLVGSVALWLLAARACLLRRWRAPAGAVAFATLAFRAVLACTAPLNFDLQSYHLVLTALARGQVVYEATTRYNYSPVWWHLLELAQACGRAVGLHPLSAIRLLTTCGDVAVALAIAVAFRRRGSRRRAAAMALLYFTNPVAIAISSGQGQFDALALAPAVLALGIAARGTTLLPALLLGAGAGLKQIVLLFAPTLLGFSRGIAAKLRDLLLAGLPFLLLVLPWVIAFPQAVLRNVVFYAGGLYGVWGWLSVLSRVLVRIPFPAAPFTFLAAALAAALSWALARRTEDGLLGARAAALGFLLLTPGFGFQMLLWPVVFAPGRAERLGVVLYTLAVSSSYANFFRAHQAFFPGLWIAWIAVGIWLFRLVAGARKGRGIRGMNPHAQRAGDPARADVR